MADAESEGDRFIVVGRERQEELQALAQAAARARDEIEQRDHEGQLCIAAERAGAIVAYRWLCPHLTLFEFGLIKGEPADVYCTETVTAPSWRLRGSDAGFESAVLRLAKSEGWRALYRLVELRPRRNLRDAQVAGWKVTGTIVLYRGR